ncbi:MULTISPECIES: hypothetical protein [unclassified Streptomyces]|uniref:hypothetical protein n=1 Tax=Streptomyces sp. NPDC127532 TaxID=3345399 RepID=UPI0036378FB9
MSAQVGGVNAPGPRAGGVLRSVGFWFESMPLGRAHLLAGFALFMAFVIESWEQLALVYVSGDLGNAFGVDEGRIGWVLSAVALGMIPGSRQPAPSARRPERPGKCLIQT